jgi:hypothetical protein
MYFAEKRIVRIMFRVVRVVATLIFVTTVKLKPVSIVMTSAVSGAMVLNLGATASA